MYEPKQFNFRTDKWTDYKIVIEKTDMDGSNKIKHVKKHEPVYIWVSVGDNAPFLEAYNEVMKSISYELAKYMFN